MQQSNEHLSKARPPHFKVSVLMNLQEKGPDNGKLKRGESIRWLPANGEMAERIASFDWNRTDLGPLENWPAHLKTYVALMLNSANPKFMAWGKEHIWLYNDAFIPILGEKHPRALGSRSSQVWSEAWAEISPMFDQVFSGHAVKMDDISLQLIRRGIPEEAHFVFSYNPATNHDGNVDGLFGTCLETTAQIHSMKAVVQAEERLQLALTAGGGIGIWDWDIKSDKLVCDAQFARIYGVDPERARKGVPAAEFVASVHPDDRHITQEAIERATKVCGEVDIEYRLKGPEGNERWVSAQGVSLPGPDGEPARLPGAVFDITDRKRSEIRRDALVALSDSIRDIEDPEELAYTAAEILGKTLGVSRAGYGLIDVRKETIVIERDWNAPGIRTLAGTLQFRDYGSYIEDLARGETVVFEDAEKDPRTEKTADALKAISAQAVVNMPVTEQGGLVALLYLNHARPRAWPEEDLELIREFAERIRTATERLRVTEALRESEARFRNVADHSPLMMWITDTDGYCTYLNRSWYEFTGQSEEEAEGFGWLTAVHPDDSDAAGKTFMTANENQESFRLEYRLRDHTGAYRWAIDAASPRFGSNGQFLGYIGSVFDIDDRKRVESLRTMQNRLLELALEDQPLEDILCELVRTVEANQPARVIGSVLLLDKDGQRLRHGAAPSLPDAYNASIDGMEIGPAAGSCGTAAYRRKPVHVSDIVSDPLWADFRDLAADHGLRACWSTPIQTRQGKILGTFAMYYREPREPAAAELELIALITHTATLIIERKQAQDALRDETRLLETLNETGTALAADLDLERIIQRVTDAGVNLTGAAFGAFFYNVENAEGESYMLYSLSGVERSAFEGFAMPRKTQIFAPTFKGEGVVRSDDITKDPRYGKNSPYSGMPEGHLPVRSYLAVPVRSHDGEIIGGLFFGHPKPAQFAERHQLLVEGIAGQAAVAIDNANLFQKAQREISQRAETEKKLQLLNEHLETRVQEEINERRQAEETLRQAQKMESIGQLTGGIAHDFNNLLQVITGNLQLLGKHVAGNAKAEERVENALLGVSRGANLASQLLAFGRRQPLDPKVINVGRLVEGLDDMLRRTLGEEIEIWSSVPDDLWNTFVDPLQVENALLNLAINARDAMNGRGRLTIEVANTSLGEDYARAHPDVSAGQYVVLAVTDTGAGMTQEIIDKVFEPFFTTKTDGRGTGLGLSMVYGFVKQSGGHAKISSEAGRGTTIKLYLPRETAMEDTTTAPVNGTTVGGNETILVVEDDDEVRTTAIEMLEDLGYRVLSAPSADEALPIVESGIAIDLLFTDVVMPGKLRSPELAQKARKLHPRIAVLFTSGYTEDAIMHEGRLDQGVYLLNKPYSRDALARKIRNVLERQRLAGEGLANSSSPTQADETGTGASLLEILLVEDDALIRMDLVEMLTEMGHSVTDVGSGEKAMEHLAAQSYDVLVTDVSLPLISGPELADSARGLQVGIGILFATGDSQFPDHERHVAAGAGILSKPYSVSDIERTLQSFVRKNQKSDLA